MMDIKPTNYQLKIEDIDEDKLKSEINGILIYSDYSLRNANFEQFTVQQVSLISKELARRHQLRLTSFRSALVELESALANLIA